MKLRLRDIVSYQGRDFVVEGLLTYHVGGTSHRLARLVDGENVRWLEPLTDDLDDRTLLFQEITGLDVGTPPPDTIMYLGHTYLPRLSGQATVETAGRAPERAGTTCEFWRYRAAGDRYLQIERWSDRTITLAGDSVHKDMIEVLPSP
jgi:hypothetical protein